MSFTFSRLYSKSNILGNSFTFIISTSGVFLETSIFYTFSSLSFPQCAARDNLHCGRRGRDNDTPTYAQPATMRLYLLPITTRRTLLYGQRLNTAAAAAQQTLLDKTQNRAAKLWADWEKKEKGWQKTVVNYGNYALRRIPYQEWGLKSAPPLSTKRKDDELRGTDTVEVIYPKLLIPTDKVNNVLETLSTEREALHKKKFIYCLIGMPITIPFALVPM